jgi:hypothetical protein
MQGREPSVAQLVFDFIDDMFFPRSTSRTERKREMCLITRTQSACPTRMCSVKQLQALSAHRGSQDKDTRVGNSKIRKHKTPTTREAVIPITECGIRPPKSQALPTFRSMQCGNRK